MNLSDHRRLVSEALHDLRALRRHAEALDLPEVKARVGEIVVRVEEEVFRVAVVGEFKRGKSTLINALLGQEILPADVLPCSATLNRVTYGLKPSVQLSFKPDQSGQRRTEQIAPEKLAEYVTKLTPDSERRASDVEEAVVVYPVRFCRDKADLIDTPGLNDEEAMTQVTMGVLPQVDAALFVILAQSPFSGYEGDFLNKLLTRELGRVIFIVNRIDEIRRPADRERILSVVRERIKKSVHARAAELHGEGTPEAEALIARIGQPRVFGVSAADALEAKLQDDAALLDKSGFPEFESALEHFLAVERGVVTLLVMADTAVAACRSINAQASIRRGALAMRGDEFEAACQRTTRELKALRSQLQEELDRLDGAATRLRLALRPRASLLSRTLLREASAAIDACPLSDSDLAQDRVDETVKRLHKAVLDRLQAAARLESERLQIEIEKGLQDEIVRLVDFGTRIERELAAIELRFNPPNVSGGIDANTAAGAGAVAGFFSRLVPGGALVTDTVLGAVTGYRVAGAKGAAAGAAAGLVSGFSVVVASAVVITSLGLPLTFPVLLPTVMLSGVASSLGARWFTRQLFAVDEVRTFRESFRETVLTQLEQDSPERIGQVEVAVDHQVTAAFKSLQDRVLTELGGVVDETQRTLDELRTRRTQEVARSEAQLNDLYALLADTTRIETHMSALATELRSLTPSA